MVASAVSSKMIEAMASAEGFKFAECLTGECCQIRCARYDQCKLVGFKYIGNTALVLEQQGYEVPFGYEEAIGFMFGSEIRDKDGVAASVSVTAACRTTYSNTKRLFSGRVRGACDGSAQARQDGELALARIVREVVQLFSVYMRDR